MVILNDFKAVSHPVQIVWFLDDYRYECVTVDADSVVCVPDNIVSNDSANIKATIVVNGLFTSVINEAFIERCRDSENAYTLSAAVLHPSNLPKNLPNNLLKNLPSSLNPVAAADSELFSNVSMKEYFVKIFKQRETHFVSTAAAAFAASLTAFAVSALYFSWPSIKVVVKRTFS
jgi:hypothetical protein